ncbi:unnamed protein product [Heligmosomoides polygyrus]|uniref:Secreted protein n=1 Tax=Heligmosomoides polygyrus TaxID=6339 RepID=A0A183G0U7_HELPZ|nr:unnamed protein product [Heligmosomoides polygyrus]
MFSYLLSCIKRPLIVGSSRMALWSAARSSILPTIRLLMVLLTAAVERRARLGPAIGVAPDILVWTREQLFRRTA